MRLDRQEAIKHRLSGKSYREISRILDIPKSTLSSWLSKLELSSQSKEQILSNGRELSIGALVKRNQKQTLIAQKRSRTTSRDAQREIQSISNNELLLIGAALYWAEGYKRLKKVKGRPVTYHPVSFTNSDPAMINVFLRFLREVCKVEISRIKVSVRFFPHQNSQALVRFWQKQTRLPVENFSKPLLSSSPTSQGLRPFTQLPYGVVQLRVSDTILFYRIMGWIEGLKQFS